MARAGFRLVRAYDGRALVGFAYGYTGERGQWWTDQAAQVLAPEVAEAWLGGHFELVSLGVVEAARGSGVGTTLLRAVTDGLPQERWVLMTTADADDPARHLYAREGWQVIGPGLRGGQVTMGRRRPTGRLTLGFHIEYIPVGLGPRPRRAGTRTPCPPGSGCPAGCT